MAMRLFGVPVAGMAARRRLDEVGAVKEAQPLEET
jgi:hypothetical protein